MNWLDIVIIVVLIFSVISGLTSGFIRTAAGLIGLILGVVIAGRYYESFASVLSFIQNQDAARIAAFIIIFLIISIIFSILGLIISKLIHATLLGWLDHLLGLFIGILSGGVFIAAILAVWIKYMGTADVITGSFMAGFLLDRFPIVLSLLPGEFDSVRQFFGK